MDNKRMNEILTADEIITAIKGIKVPNPVINAIYWEDPIVSTAWFCGGLIVIGVMAEYTFINLVSMFIMLLMIHCICYSFICRYTNLRLPENFIIPPKYLDVSPLTVLKGINTVTIWINRSVCTMGHLLIGAHIWKCVAFLVIIIEIRSLLMCMERKTVYKMALWLAFILPKIFEEFFRRVNLLWIEPLPVESFVYWTIVSIIVIKDMLRQAIKEVGIAISIMRKAVVNLAIATRDLIFRSGPNVVVQAM